MVAVVGLSGGLMAATLGIVIHTTVREQTAARRMEAVRLAPRVAQAHNDHAQARPDGSVGNAGTAILSPISCA